MARTAGGGGVRPRACAAINTAVMPDEPVTADEPRRAGTPLPLPSR